MWIYKNDDNFVYILHQIFNLDKPEINFLFL